MSMDTLVDSKAPEELEGPRTIVDSGPLDPESQANVIAFEQAIQQIKARKGQEGWKRLGTIGFDAYVGWVLGQPVAKAPLVLRSK